MKKLRKTLAYKLLGYSFYVFVIGIFVAVCFLTGKYACIGNQCHPFIGGFILLGIPMLATAYVIPPIFISLLVIAILTRNKQLNIENNFKLWWSNLPPVYQIIATKIKPICDIITDIGVVLMLFWFIFSIWFGLKYSLFAT